MSPLETRQSLIVRLKSEKNELTWRDFDCAYEGFLNQLARRQGVPERHESDRSGRMIINLKFQISNLKSQIRNLMTPISSLCDATLLQRSLNDQLSEQQQEQLAAHLSECDVCRQQLEALASDAASWKDVGRVLREETSGEHAAAPHGGSTLIPQTPISGADADREFNDGSRLKPSDFIVDFLQPSQNKESLGRLGNIEICTVHRPGMRQPLAIINSHRVK